MNVCEALERTSRSLQAAGIADARMESEFLIAAALQIPKTHLILNTTTALSAELQTCIEHWTLQRSQRQPLAYIVGEQPFMDYSLQVSPAVLIPRPETELLVERALHFLESIRHPAIVADIGTGSGNIAIALARNPKVRHVFAIDISSEALAQARANAARCGVIDRCQWLQGDLLDPIRNFQEPLDLIAANLPYIRTEDLPGLQPEVRQEPPLALDGGKSGLELINRLIEPALQCLRPGGVLFLEIGADQSTDVEKCLRKTVGWSSVELFKDLAGWPRIVQAVKGESWTS
ncbi:MAG: peptide chain release factor N(5)-glutamine methyltransferase [Elusimicrobiota bacterium]|jgi:release factor glutamine methyltransferase